MPSPSSGSPSAAGGLACRRARLCSLLGAALLGVLGCSSSSPSADIAPRAPKKRLVLATNAEPDTLNTLFTEMTSSSAVALLGHRELTVYNDRWELIPDLAEQVPSLENGLVRLIDTDELDAAGRNKQKMEVTWQIRKSARWQDGVPVTADDFRFGFEIQRDERQEIVDRDIPNRIEKMEARGEDRKTLVVTWREPYAFYADYRVHRALPAHVLRPRYRRPDGTTHDLRRDPYGQAPLSNGPFRFQVWEPGQYIIYERNDQYEPRAKLDEVVIRIIPNNAAMQTALAAGDIDGILETGGLSVSEAERLHKEYGERFSYFTVPGLVWAHIDFNLDNPLLQDRRVRRALAHAVDRQTLINVLFGGKYTPAHTFLPPRHWGYDANLPELKYDVAEAARLLDEAGYRLPAPGGIRVGPHNTPLRLSISAVAGIRDVEQIEQVIQSDLRKVGVELVIENQPAKVFFGESARHRKFKHLSFYSWVMSPSSFGHTLWQSDMIPSEANRWQGQNYSGWRDDEVTALLRQVPGELDLSRRQAILAKVQARFLDALPVLPMYFRPVVAVMRRELVGFSPTGTLTPSSWNAQAWDLPQTP